MYPYSLPLLCIHIMPRNSIQREKVLCDWCQRDPHLVDVVDEAVGLLAALGAPHEARLVDDGAHDEGGRQDGQQRQDRQSQSEAGSLFNNDKFLSLMNRVTEANKVK
jgi:hypothetical protein